jgi:hypothetical protein
MDIFPACQVIKKGDRLGIDVATRYGEEFQAALKKQKGYVQVILKKPSKSRTVLQNSTYRSLWSLYYISGLHSCSSEDELHANLRGKYGVEVVYNILGVDKTVLPSTTSYDTNQMSDLISGTMLEMEMNGILTLDKYGEKYMDIVETMRANEETRLLNQRQDNIGKFSKE